MGRRAWTRIDAQMRKAIIRAAAGGLTYREVADQVLCSERSVCGVLAPLGGVWRSDLESATTGYRLSLDDRIEIYAGILTGEPYAAIGRGLGRPTSTVSREVTLNGGAKRYSPMRAHRRAARQARRPKTSVLAGNAVLCEWVIDRLTRLWSPQQIQRRLIEEFPSDTTMRVSHETIYKTLYVQGRGELRRELTACLRTGRAVRKTRARMERPRQRIPDMVMIADRPAEIEDRAVPGHWEGDLIVGKNSGSAIGTIVERTTRYLILLYLENDHTAQTVRDAMAEAILKLPEDLRRSVTWDQGIEMVQHAQFTLDTNIDVYFCDPHSPWQRGTNENTNGLLRQYFPKGTDLSVHSPSRLQEVADQLNSRPRQTLNWKTPAEALTQLLIAATD